MSCTERTDVPPGIDLRGKTYGQWTVLDQPPVRRNNHWYWQCRCTCGTEKQVSGTNLINKISTRCRTCSATAAAHAKRLDLTGETYGRWTVLGGARRHSNGARYWNCRCTCGHEQAVQQSALRSGESTQCLACRNLSYRKKGPAQ